MSASVPLSQALPWSPDFAVQRTILVCDSVQTDGRFLLHSLASDVLKNKQNKGRVLWLSCGAWTERLIATALKKMGCDYVASCLRSNTSLSFQEDDSTSLLQILSIPVEFATRLDDQGTNDDADLDGELYVKELYHRIKVWVNASNNESLSGPSWIILDDASALAELVGERLTYFFILSLRALMNKISSNEGTFGLMLRCANDSEQEDATEAEAVKATTVNPSSSHHSADWIGAGGQEDQLFQRHYQPWEQQLTELADGIVDVLPLASGYSREAHGRLVFTERPGGRGWTSTQDKRNKVVSKSKEASRVSPLVSSVINYCLTDTCVMAIRLRGMRS